MPTVTAANVVSNFGGTSGLTPLLGAFVADAYLGRYKTIAISSVIYMVVRLSSLSSQYMKRISELPEVNVYED